MTTALRNLVAARELGVRASVVALFVAAAGTAATAATEWARRRASAASHRQAGWQQ